MASAPLPADPTLDEIREAVAPRLASHAAFDGWTDKAVESAAMEIGVDADLAKESAKLQSLQIKQQLGAQALSIANQAPQNILSLFR